MALQGRGRGGSFQNRKEIGGRKLGRVWTWKDSRRRALIPLS
jgi:hypothetical protein